MSVDRLKLAPSTTLGVTLERAIYSAILDDIRRGALSPGQALIEAQLSARFGVSKTPVREALIRLERDGLAVFESHKGARVIEPTAEDVHRIYEVRRWIEAPAASLLARSREPSVLEKLKASIERSREGLGRIDEDYLRSVREFSDLLIESTGNQYATQILERLRAVLQIASNVEEWPTERRRRSVERHAAIFAAIVAGDEAAAADAVVEHLSRLEEDDIAGLRPVSSAGA